MKFITFIFCIGIKCAVAQIDSLTAGVYTWPAEKDKTNTAFKIPMLSGSAAILSSLEMNAVKLAPTESLSFGDQSERVIFIKSGTLTLTMKDSIWMLQRGSVVIILPEERATLRNISKTAAAFHEMKYRSALPSDPARGKTSGGSRVVDWNKITFKPHDRGGVRSFFNRPTAMTQRFENHVTTLNAGLNSHDPHTHVAEEIILVLEGDVDMLIGDKHYQATAGDALFAPTQILHGLKNRGNTPCSYYAFQWK